MLNGLMPDAIYFKVDEYPGKKALPAYRTSLRKERSSRSNTFCWVGRKRLFSTQIFWQKIAAQTARLLNFLKMKCQFIGMFRYFQKMKIYAAISCPVAGVPRTVSF
jgi:hypothetical protein